MRWDELDELLAVQDGVISRRQVLSCGGADNDVERLIRRRQWARAFEGVYIHHTGPPTWRQRAWSAVLLHHPAALGGQSALRADGIDIGHESDPIEVAVARHRRVYDPPRVVTRRVTDFSDVALLNLGPPRVRIEHAALTVAARAVTEDAAVAVLGQVRQRRRTTPARLLTAAQGRTRLRHRRLLLAVLGDLAEGTNSALERRYLVDVERAHGLPVGRRQLRVTNGRQTSYRDVDYEGLRTVIELDGRLGHEHTNDRWDDLDRDIASAVAGHVTIRAGWRQTLEACRLAVAVGAVLQSRGWTGSPGPCAAGCPVGTGEDLRLPVPENLPRRVAHAPLRIG